MLIRSPRLLILDLSEYSLDLNLRENIHSCLLGWGIPSLNVYCGEDQKETTSTRVSEMYLDRSLLNASFASGDYSEIIKHLSIKLSGSDFAIFSVPKDAISEVGLASEYCSLVDVLKIAIVVIVDQCTDLVLQMIRNLPKDNVIGFVSYADPEQSNSEGHSPLTDQFGLEKLGILHTSGQSLSEQSTQKDSLNLDAIIRKATRFGTLQAPVSFVPRNNHRKRSPLKPSERRSGGKVIMVQGATSDAGKTFLVTALARYFSNRGLSVAPFKGQNISNNARVVAGGEIGVAQYFQALAGRSVPDVRMNPVLIKPQKLGSQVIVMGKPDYDMTMMPWRLRKPLYWPPIKNALNSLRKDYDLIIVEGAGSPMETYLRDNDVTNMKVALESNANVLLAADAARGGVFPHLYGTWDLMTPPEKKLIKGFILNLFFDAGNAELLKPGVEHIQSLTNQTPVLGIIPEVEHRLPAEDLYSLKNRRTITGQVVAVVAYPKISNFDEFKTLEAIQNVTVVWAKSPDQIRDAEIVILPGSKHVSADLVWMRENDLDSAIIEFAQSGKRLLGICGGLQMLGGVIRDPLGIEGSGEGLGLLSIETEFKPEKIQRQVSKRVGQVDGPWSALSGLTINGYEIRQGRSVLTDKNPSAKTILEHGSGFAQDNILAFYIHGVFENNSVLKACFNQDICPRQELENTFENLADVIDEYIDTSLLESIALG